MNGPHGKLQYLKKCLAYLRFEYVPYVQCTIMKLTVILITEMQTHRHYNPFIIAEPFDKEGNTLGHITAKSGNVNLFKVINFQY